MPDEATAPELEPQDKPQETPDPSVSETREGTTPTEQAEPFSEHFDPATLPDELRGAYKQLQGAATKKFQEAAALRTPDRLSEYLRTLTPEDQAAVLQEAGYTLAGEEEQPQEDYFSPDEELRAQVEELRKWRDTQQQEASTEQAEQQVVSDINGQLSKLEEDLGRELSEKEAQHLGEQAYNRALANGAWPDVRAEYEAIFTDLLPEERKRWVESKRTPQVKSGASASQEIDLDDPEVRQEWILQQALGESGSPGA